MQASYQTFELAVLSNIQWKCQSFRVQGRNEGKSKTLYPKLSRQIEVSAMRLIFNKSFYWNVLYVNTGSSKDCSTVEVIVVIMPTKRLAHAKATKAVLGTENKKLAGYINGIAATLYFRIKFIFKKITVKFKQNNRIYFTQKGLVAGSFHRCW